MTTEINKQMIKRRRYLVAKKFQLKYVGLILAFMSVTAIVCAYAVYYTSMVSLGEKLANVYPQGRLVSIVRMVNIRILLSMLLLSPIVIIIGIFLSHKIAGPIYRMEKFLSGMATGDLSTRITLRQGDELTSLADRINYVADNLKTSLGVQKGHVSSALNEVIKLKAMSGQALQDPSILENITSRLDKELIGMSNELDKFKL